MNKSARLQSARAWLPAYDGRNILRAYRKKYGVDWHCAIRELEMLKVPLDQKYFESLKNAVAQQALAKRKRQEKKQIENQIIDQIIEKLICWESDENFEYII